MCLNTSRRFIGGWLLLCLLTWQRAGAQLLPADDFFNSGAQFYISNNIPAALDRVEMGLKTYPNDEKLKKLEQLLKQQQQQQQQQNQQNQQQQQQSKNNQQQDKKNQQQQNQNQQSQDQQKKSDQEKQDQQKQNQADQKKNEEQPKQQDQKNAGDKSKDEKQPEPSGQPVKPGEMSPEEAKRLLDAQKGNEQLLQLKPEAKPHNPDRPVKDW